MSFSSRKTAPNNVNLDESQTLQNKTLDGSTVIQSGADIQTPAIIDPTRADVKKDTLANLQTYASTASNGQLVYATDSKKMFQVLDSALAEVGGGSAGINYISNPDAEVNGDGWTQYRNTVDGVLPDDFNGTPDVGYSGVVRSTNSPLRGTASFILDLTMAVEANAQGHGSYYAFSVETADLAKKLTISFDYDASAAEYNDGDVRVYIWDVTNSKLIRVNGEDLMAGKGTHYAQFQTDATSTSYRLVLHYAGTSKDFIVKFDNVQVGPREVTKGTIVTDPIDFTPTLSASTTNPTLGTGSISTGKYHREGKFLYVSSTIQFGSSGTNSGSGTYYIDLPSGLSIDTDALSSFTLISSGQIKNEAGASDEFINIMAAYDGVNTDKVRLHITESAGVSPTISSSNPWAWGANDFIRVNFKVPIQGWSSNAKMSEDLGGREVVVNAVGNSSGTVINNSTDVPYNTIIKDTTASWNGTQFTTPETGQYLITGSLRTTSSVTMDIRFFIDGVDANQVISYDTSKVIQAYSGSIELQKGQQLSIRNASAATLNDDSKYHNLTIQKLASPQTILETETVAARYTSNSGQAINASFLNVVFEDKEIDTHNAYNSSTGIYTVPVSGYYNICTSIRTASVAWSANNQTLITIYINQSTEEVLNQVFAESAGTRSMTIPANTITYLNKGDEVEIRRQCSISTTLEPNKRGNFFSIARIK